MLILDPSRRMGVRDNTGTTNNQQAELQTDLHITIDHVRRAETKSKSNKAASLNC